MHSLFGIDRVLLHLLLSHGNESTWQEYARSVVINNDFQIALLICAMEVVAYILPNYPSFPALTAQLGRLNKVMDLWEAIRCYRSAQLCLIWLVVDCFLSVKTDS